MLIEMSESRKAYAWFDKQSCKREKLANFLELIYTSMTFLALVQPFVYFYYLNYEFLNVVKGVNGNIWDTTL